MHVMQAMLCIGSDGLSLQRTRRTLKGPAGYSNKGPNAVYLGIAWASLAAEAVELGLSQDVV
jgi:hypothetical protein